MAKRRKSKRKARRNRPVCGLVEYLKLLAEERLQPLPFKWSDLSMPVQSYNVFSALRGK